MSGDFERGGRIDFLESSSRLSSVVFLLWLTPSANPSSFRSTSPLACLCLGVPSSSEAQLVAPALPLITFFTCAGALKLLALDPILGPILLLPLTKTFFCSSLVPSLLGEFPFPLVALVPSSGGMDWPCVCGWARFSAGPCPSTLTFVLLFRRSALSSRRSSASGSQLATPSASTVVSRKLGSVIFPRAFIVPRQS